MRKLKLGKVNEAAQGHVARQQPSQDQTQKSMCHRTTDDISLPLLCIDVCDFGKEPLKFSDSSSNAFIQPTSTSNVNPLSSLKPFHFPFAPASWTYCPTHSLFQMSFHYTSSDSHLSILSLSCLLPHPRQYHPETTL